MISKFNQIFKKYNCKCLYNGKNCQVSTKKQCEEIQRYSHWLNLWGKIDEMWADLYVLKLVRIGFDGPSGTICLYVPCFYVHYLYYTGRNNGMIKCNCNSDEFPYKNLRLLSGGVTRELPGKCHSCGGVGWQSTFCVFDLQAICSSQVIIIWREISLGNDNSARF